MPSNHERITKSLDLLTHGLFPYVERRMKAIYAERWLDAARESFRRGRGPNIPEDEALQWDAHALLTVMWDQWNSVFRHDLGFLERSLVSELREFRNDWAHQRPFDFDDTFRVLDSIQRLLTIAEDEAGIDEVTSVKREMLREQFVVQEDVATRRRDLRRERTFLLSLYVVCCLLIVITTYDAFGWQSWPVLSLVLASFAYFSFKLLTHRPGLIPTSRPAGLRSFFEESTLDESAAG